MTGVTSPVMRVSVGDVELYVHEKGEGRPIVALHGGPGLDGSRVVPGNRTPLPRTAGASSRPTIARTAAPTRATGPGGRSRRWRTTSSS